MADQQFLDALHEQDKIDQLVVDLNLAQYTNIILSVNGATGDVILVTTDIEEGTHLYFTNARADERVQLLLDDLLITTNKGWSSTKIDASIAAGVVASAAKWTTPMDLTFSGDLVGVGSFDGSTPITISVTVPGKVDNARVLTDVPAGALFTDTVYDDTTIWAAVDLNTAKVGITTQQAADITANNAKNTYPPEDLAKMLTIETGAEINVQSDWNVTDDAADEFIKNKPNVEQNVQSDWNVTDDTADSYIKNKPDNSLGYNLNLLYNGHMQINQENKGLIDLPNISGFTNCYDTYIVGAQADLNPAGIVKQLKDGLEDIIRVDILEAATDPEISEDYISPMVSCNMLNANQGDFMTLSFDFKSNVVSDTFGFSIFNVVAEYMVTPPVPVPYDTYFDQFSYQTPDVKQRIVITFPVPAQEEWSVPLPNTRDTWLLTMAVASKFTASSNTPQENKGIWVFGKDDGLNGGSYAGLPDDEWWADTVGNYIEASNFKLEKGSVATENPLRNYADDLRDVQTQYNKIVGFYENICFVESTGLARCSPIDFPDRMSGTPVASTGIVGAWYDPPTGTEADGIRIFTITQESLAYEHTNSLADWVPQEIARSELVSYIIDAR